MHACEIGQGRAGRMGSGAWLIPNRHAPHMQAFIAGWRARAPVCAVILADRIVGCSRFSRPLARRIIAI